jgi:hypothetical protein
VTAEQAKKFVRDGFVCLPGAVPEDAAMEARRLLFERMGRLRDAAAHTVFGKRDKRRNAPGLKEALIGAFGSAGSDVFMGLFEESGLKKTVERAVGGKLLPMTGVQIATLFPADSAGETNEAGYLNRDTPHHGWVGHLDGLWNGGTQVPRAGTNIRGKHLAAWRREPSTNGMVREFAQHNANLANFTALVGVALSDQRREGSGNLGLLRGAHKHMAAVFRTQREHGGPLGPDGPGWPREHGEAPNRHGLRHYPEAVRKQYERGATRSADGHYWPRPTLMKLNVGDAVIVHSLTPHSATMVTTGVEPRMMLYFRCTAARRPKNNHRVYPAALCDALLEWRGVRRMLDL